MSIADLTIGEIQEWVDKAKNVKTIGEWKAVGRELRDKHSLTDREAIDILNGRLLK
jgi:hypothetical protein